MAPERSRAAAGHVGGRRLTLARPRADLGGTGAMETACVVVRQVIRSSSGEDQSNAESESST